MKIEKDPFTTVGGSFSVHAGAGCADSEHADLGEAAVSGSG
ncbi:hypothetical protein [Catellatospora vulcania]|jgi:hypothetical protein|nr:hypothetical protein [Catellatospora vulcania]